MTLERVPFEFDTALLQPSVRQLSEAEVRTGVLQGHVPHAPAASSLFFSSSHEHVSLELLRFTP